MRLSMTILALLALTPDAKADLLTSVQPHVAGTTYSDGTTSTSLFKTFYPFTGQLARGILEFNVGSLGSVNMAVLEITPDAATFDVVPMRVLVYEGDGMLTPGDFSPNSSPQPVIGQFAIGVSKTVPTLLDVTSYLQTVQSAGKQFLGFNFQMEMELCRGACDSTVGCCEDTGVTVYESFPGDGSVANNFRLRIVLPTVGNVPTISRGGLGVMIILLCVAGAIVVAQRTRTTNMSRK